MRPVIDSPIFIPYGPLVRHTDAGTTTAMVDPVDIVVPVDYDLSDDGARIAYAEATVSGSTVNGTAVVGDTTTRATIATIGTFTSSLSAQTQFPVALSGDGTRFAFAHNVADPTADVAITVGAVAGGDALSVPTRYASDLFLSDDGATLAWQAAADEGTVLLERRLPAGPTTTVSADPVGAHVASVSSSALSGDGAWCAFTTDDASLVPGNTHAVTQVYTRSIARPSPPPT
jgi:hypothetical protein